MCAIPFLTTHNENVYIAYTRIFELEKNAFIFLYLPSVLLLCYYQFSC